MEKFFLKFDSWHERTSLTIGLIPSSVLIGVFFLIAASLSTSFQWTPVHHGRGFTQLSEHPFNFSDTNDLRFRILSPLIGYLLFFRGPAFKILMLITLVMFFALLFLYGKNEKYRPVEAFAFTALAAFSTISIHQLNYPAYTDSMTYLLIVLFMMYFRKKYWNIVLLSLLLFNHENTLFLFPFFFLLCLGENFKLKNIFITSFYFLIAIFAYAAYRKFVTMHQPVEYSLFYYFSKGNMEWTREHVLPNLASGIFQAFRLFWIFPAAALAINFYEKRYAEILLMISCLGCVFLQFLIAYDISRLACLAFPAVLIGARRVHAFTGSGNFLKFTFALILLNFLIPSYYVGALEPVRMRPFWM